MPPERGLPRCLDLRVDVERALAFVAANHAAIDPADEPSAHRALDVQRWVVRRDPQRRVDVPERIRIIRLAAETMASRDRDEVVLAPVAILALRPEVTCPRVREQQ